MKKQFILLLGLGHLLLVSSVYAVETNTFIQSHTPSQLDCSSPEFSVPYGHSFVVKDVVLPQETYERLHNIYGKGSVYFINGEEAKYAILDHTGMQACIGSVSKIDRLPLNSLEKLGSSLGAFDLE